MSASGPPDYSYVYDKAKYHYDGDFPPELPAEQAFVHTGMFLGWVVENNLLSEESAEDLTEEIQRFRARSLTGPRLFELLDGALVADMLSDEGNAYAYCDFDRGDYVSDYDPQDPPEQDHLSPGPYTTMGRAPR